MLLARPRCRQSNVNVLQKVYSQQNLSTVGDKYEKQRGQGAHDLKDLKERERCERQQVTSLPEVGILLARPRCRQSNVNVPPLKSQSAKELSNFGDKYPQKTHKVLL